MQRPQVRDCIALLSIEDPPGNSLGRALRERIVREVEAAQRDPEVRGIVLTGSDRAFSAGADISEPGTPLQLQEPILSTVISCVEGCSKPVVAAIAGMALGGGLELAHACHGRVSHASAGLASPK